VREPRPLKNHDGPAIPTLEGLLEDPARRRFLELAGAGALAVAGGGWLAACGPSSDDDNSAPGDDDDTETYWDDDDGGIDDDDDASAVQDCRLPRSGYHEATIELGNVVSYSVVAWVTGWSVVDYLHDHEDEAMQVLDAVISAHNCASLSGPVGQLQMDMASALTDLVRDVGGLTCSVQELTIYIDGCL